MKLENNLRYLADLGAYRLGNLDETVTKELSTGEALILDGTIKALSDDATVLSEIMRVAIRAKIRLMVESMAASHKLVFLTPGVNRIWICPLHSDVDYWVEVKIVGDTLAFKTGYSNSSQARVPDFIRGLSLPTIDIRQSDEVILNSLRKRFTKIEQWFITAEQLLQEENK